MASDERGTKRTCPVTGKKFYDLNKDPVVSPYTGKSYPMSFFEAPPEKAPAKAPAPVKEKRAEVEETELDPAAAEAGAEVISLNDAEKSTNDDEDDDDEESGEKIPDVEDVEVDEDLGDDDDTFLEDDEDDEDIDFDVEVDDEEER
ncbi:TIGR02300 family protein [Pelagibacterium montanilacus]|uniref:TIGR02300 family protein n=1 Tax=Pelagibacterium montanilacus TaxID=2185280 RepID=UPI000F8F145B|nr:TIGR02300 family protein [Pelagibacterium montanilacus]